MLHRVLVIISVFVVAFCNYGILQAYGVLFTATLDKFREGRAQTFLVQSVLVGMSLGAGVFGGYLIKRLNLRLVFTVGSILLPLGLMASFFATSVTFLVVSIGIVSGVGISFTYVSAAVVLSSVIPERHKTTAFSVQSVACGAPGVILPYLFTWLTVTYGLSGTFLVYGGIALHNLAIAILFSNTAIKEHNNVKTGPKKVISAEKSTIPSASNEFKRNTLTESGDDKSNHIAGLHGTSYTLSPVEKTTAQSKEAHCLAVKSISHKKSSGGSRTATHIIFLVANTFVNGNVAGIQTICQDVGVYKGLSTEQTLSCIAAYNLASTLGRFLPFVLQKVTDNPFISPIVASMSGVFGQMLVLMTSHYYAILIGYVLTGITDGGASSSAPIVIFKILNQESQAVGFGLMLTLIGTLAISSGPIFGAMYDATHSYTVVLLVTSSIFAVGVVLFTACFVLFQPQCCSLKKVGGSERVLHVYTVGTVEPKSLTVSVS